MEIYTKDNNTLSDNFIDNIKDANTYGSKTKNLDNNSDNSHTSEEDLLKNLQENWNDILYSHRDDFDLQKVTFETYIVPLNIISLKDGVLTLSSPENDSAINLIKKKYLRNLQLSIAEYAGTLLDLEIISRTAEETSGLSSINNTAKEQANDTVSESSTKKKVYVPNYDENNFKLNPNYTFEKFIVGNNNNLAHSVSLAVAEAPSEVYNPLFIHGGVGLGKTHLMQAIAHHIMNTRPEKKVLYVTSERFTYELIDYLQNKKKGSDFRNKYRNVDVLLIDDIQFIIGKVSTQEEFFHTFNDLYQYNKQIVMTSDKPPKDMETLPQRLKSRFSEGMICDIQIPSYETKRAILNQKIEDRFLHDIPDDVRDYIAKNIKSSIRELEGSINTLQAYAALKKSDINLDLAMEALKDLVNTDNNKIITPELILDVVSEHYGVTTEDILSKKKSNDIAFPRQVVMYLCRQMIPTSAKSIGDFLGGRDHSTVLHGSKLVSNELLSNSQLKATIEIIMKKIDPSLKTD